MEDSIKEMINNNPALKFAIAAMELLTDEEIEYFRNNPKEFDKFFDANVKTKRV